MEFGQKKVYGNLKTINTGFGGIFKNPTEWRLDKKLAGGGPLMDLGIYALQAGIYTSGELPTNIKAEFTTKNKEFFKDIDGSLEWGMTFPSGHTGQFYTSYEEQYNYYQTEAEKGIFELKSAFSYRGISGKTSDGVLNFPAINQQARQMDDFARCILENKETIVPGEMGLRDMYLIEKIYEAAESGKTISLSSVPNVLHKV